MFNSYIRGWINYYGRYYKSALYPTLRHIDRILAMHLSWSFGFLPVASRRSVAAFGAGGCSWRDGSIFSRLRRQFPRMTVGIVAGAAYLRPAPAVPGLVW
jgi:hypothetical protein